MRETDIGRASGKLALGVSDVWTPLKQVGRHADGNSGRLLNERRGIDLEGPRRGAGQQCQRMA